jgi:hypothetical protein
VRGFERYRLISLFTALVRFALVRGQMKYWFGVDHRDVDRLLAEWRWLCSKPMTLIARIAFAFHSAIA